MPTRRAAVLLLLVAFVIVGLHPFLSALDGWSGPGSAELTKREAGGSHPADKTFAARKSAPETVSAGVKRPSAPPLRRTLPAAAVPACSLALQAPERGGLPTAPAYLQSFRPAHPHGLRAPPV